MIRICEILYTKKQWKSDDYVLFAWFTNDIEIVYFIRHSHTVEKKRLRIEFLILLSFYFLFLSLHLLGVWSTHCIDGFDFTMICIDFMELKKTHTHSTNTHRTSFVADQFPQIKKRQQ